jgi:hypothetical protein
MLSPAISGSSIYLFLLIPFVDPAFVRYLSTVVIDRRYVLAAGALLAASVPYGSPLFVFKVFSIVITVSYIAYTVRIGTFRLHTYMSLNVLVAAIQCVGFLAFQREILYPSDIGNYLYGGFALPTGQTGMGAEGYLLPFRFSGLSREPGFFSSLLIVSYLLLLDQKEIKNRKWHLAVHLVGLLIAFSKISAVFFPFFLFAYFLRFWMDRIPKIVIIGGTLVSLMVMTYYYYGAVGIDIVDISIRHRTIGYAVLQELDVVDLVFGVGFRNIASRVSEIPIIAHSIWYYDMPGAVVAGSGLSSVIIDHGLLYFLMLIFLLYFLKAGSYELFLFLLLTINENPLTSSSFVLIGIYYMLFGGQEAKGSRYPPRRNRWEGTASPSWKPA